MISCCLRVLGIFILTQACGRAQRLTQDILMMQYLEQRLAQLEDRLTKCHEESSKYAQELYDFSTETRSRLDSLNTYKSELKNQVDNVVTRVEKIERDVDYLEAQTPQQPCIEVDENLLKEQVREAESKKKAKLKPIPDCDGMLTSIKSLKIVKKSGDTQGSWMKDPAKDSPKIYFLSGSKNDMFMEFSNMKAFTEGNAAKNITLPFPWQGTGHVVYNGFLYFHKSGSTNEIIKYHIRSKNVTDSMILPNAGRVPAYQLSPYTFIDLALDEQGLWSIHADPDINGNIVLTKIDRGSLAVEHSWDTTCSSKEAEAAFLICGTLFVAYNSEYGGRSRIQCIYDAHDIATSDDMPILYFPKSYTRHSVMHYNFKEKQIYSWDDGYQTLYKVTTKKKSESP
ncbi:olfactomedin-like protein 1 [Erpetoichthys calabaricus]|uniref:Olfactomedin like 1 n=1 Tax=Erpetoichthys calabaricus TaxID=27687 RepID=A0A8C4RUH2_ERPCA|nr:olfactomedin-like protein 1 [Erpetoichthys calabaricus]